MVALKSTKVSEQKFQVPMEFVEPDDGRISAGELRICVKYKHNSKFCASGEGATPP